MAASLILAALGHEAADAPTDAEAERRAAGGLLIAHLLREVTAIRKLLTPRE